MSGQVASRYGKSLIQLAIESKVEDRIFQEMSNIHGLASENDELIHLLNSPVIAADKKVQVLSTVFADNSDLTKKFLSLLVSKGREGDLAAISANYMKRYQDLKGLAKATVRSAVKLDQSTLDQIQKYLKGMIGKETINLENVIDTSVLGGMVIEFEDKVLDLSVANELKEYRKKLIYN